MYHVHFGLRRAPFKITPDTGFFYPGGNRGAILEALLYAVSHGEGVVKVSGEVGSGKTMLCRMLATRLPPEIETVYLAHPSVSPREALRAVALEMSLPAGPDASRLEITHALQQRLLERHSQGERVVLLVEEAQGMPLDTLEEIRLLSNLETEREKLLQIVLFGQPELDRSLSRSDMRQLKERITHGFVLAPLTSAEIRDYLDFRLRAAGYHGPPLFSKLAARRVARYSRGLTRRVNIIADKALLAAYSAGSHAVLPKHIRAAAKDSGYRPRPWFSRAGAGLVLLAALGGLGVVLHTASRGREAEPIQAPAVAARATPAAPSPPMPGAADPLATRLEAGARWLSAAAPGTFTIQLMGAREEKQLEGVLADLDPLLGSHRVFVYRTVADGKPWLAVLYGSFADRAAAREALSRLPPRLKAWRPYLRSVAGIRAEIGSRPAPAG